MLLSSAGVRTRLACRGRIDPGVHVAEPDDLDAMLGSFTVAIREALPLRADSPRVCASPVTMPGRPRSTQWYPPPPARGSFREGMWIA